MAEISPGARNKFQRLFEKSVMVNAPSRFTSLEKPPNKLQSLIQIQVLKKSIAPAQKFALKTSLPIDHSVLGIRFTNTNEKNDEKYERKENTTPRLVAKTIKLKKWTCEVIEQKNSSFRRDQEPLPGIVEKIRNCEHTIVVVVTRKVGNIFETVGHLVP
jgi:hypothetical protein